MIAYAEIKWSFAAGESRKISDSFFSPFATVHETISYLMQRGHQCKQISDYERGFACTRYGGISLHYISWEHLYRITDPDGVEKIVIFWEHITTPSVESRLNSLIAAREHERAAV